MMTVFRSLSLSEARDVSAADMMRFLYLRRRGKGEKGSL